MEHPILFLDLLFEKLGMHIPPHVSYAVVVALILLGLGWLAGRQVSLVPKAGGPALAVFRGRSGDDSKAPTANVVD